MTTTLTRSDRGYSTAAARRITGATIRQAEYWTRNSFITPTTVETVGACTTFSWSVDDLYWLRAMVASIRCGITPARWTGARRRHGPTLEPFPESPRCIIFIGSSRPYSVPSEVDFLSLIRGAEAFSVVACRPIRAHVDREVTRLELRELES